MLETINNGEGGLSVREKLNRMFSELYKSSEREINFVASQHVKVLHIYNESIDGVNLDTAILELEYSDDNGASWFLADLPATPIPVIAGSETLWRVRTYSEGESSGTIVLKSTLE
jgi:coproporphyrinogen III oxidase